MKRLLSGGVVLFCLLNLAGCGTDLSSILDGGFSQSDLTGTWSGTLTQAGAAQVYKLTVDSAGNFTSDSGVAGVASISGLGSVSFIYSTADGYTVTLKGTLNSEKTDITMSKSSWTGVAEGSSAITGTLSKASSNNFRLTDLVGTWSGSLKIAGQTTNYEFTVDSAGNLTLGDDYSGTATISTSGTVVFMYSTDDNVITLEGTMNNAKTKVTLTTTSWTGETTGSTTVTGYVVKD